MFTSETCSLPLGSCLFGIPIHLHVSFFLLLGLEVLAAISRIGDFAFTMLTLVIYGPILLVTIVVHELGHAISNRRFGGEAQKIVLWPLGGFVVLGRTDGVDVMEDFWVAIAGPATHIPMILFWFAVFITVSPISAFSARKVNLEDLDSFRGWFGAMCEWAILLNIILFVFNLLVPAYPLDGGRCLAALLVNFGTPVTRAAKITSITAMIIAGCMIIYGFVGLFEDIGGGIIFFLIGAWIFYVSFQLYGLASEGRVHEHPMFNKECYKQAGLPRDDNCAGNQNVVGGNVAAPIDSAPTEGASPPARSTEGRNWTLFGRWKQKVNNPTSESSRATDLSPPPVVGAENIPAEDHTNSACTPNWASAPTAYPPASCNEDHRTFSTLGGLFKKKKKDTTPPVDPNFV